MAARGKDALDLAIRSVFVGKEHHAELAHDLIEAAIREGQCRGVGRLEFDLFARSKLCARDFEHWRIEIGRRQAYAGRQEIAPSADADRGLDTNGPLVPGGRRRSFVCRHPQRRDDLPLATSGDNGRSGARFLGTRCHGCEW